MTNKFFGFVSILTFLALFADAKASNSGSCAPVDANENPIGNCTWTLEGDTLKFSGQGPMRDYKAYQAPWYEERKSITSVEIAVGITSIGKYSLFQTNITDLYIPASVEKINGCSQMSALENVVFEEGSKLTEIGSGAFMYDTKLKKLILPEGVEFLGNNILAASRVEALVLPDSLFINENGLVSMTFTNVAKIYCSEQNAAKCEEYFKTAIDCYKHDGSGKCYQRPLSEGATLGIYEKFGNEYYVDGRFYEKPQDIGTPNHIKKRIYTIDEANQVAGKTNTFSIRYR